MAQERGAVKTALVTVQRGVLPLVANIQERRMHVVQRLLWLQPTVQSVMQPLLAALLQPEAAAFVATSATFNFTASQTETAVRPSFWPFPPTLRQP